MLGTPRDLSEAIMYEESTGSKWAILPCSKHADLLYVSPRELLGFQLVSVWTFAFLGPSSIRREKLPMLTYINQPQFVAWRVILGFLEGVAICH